MITNNFKRQSATAYAWVIASLLLSFTFFGSLTVPRERLTTVLPAGFQEENNTEVFIQMIKEKYPKTTCQGEWITVSLHPALLYRLHGSSTYQELVTVDTNCLKFITNQLDANGIEYDVTKNERAPYLLHEGEWMISWGGVLYLPQVEREIHP